MAVGYSGTPLVKKLGVKPGMRVAWPDAPDTFGGLLDPLPDDVRIVRRVAGHLDLVVAFGTERARLRRRLPGLMAAIRPDGMAWIAWPKKASGVPTDLTDNVVRETALPLGLVDIKVCAIDETWSGLRLMIRKELRTEKPVARAKTSATTPAPSRTRRRASPR